MIVCTTKRTELLPYRRQKMVADLVGGDISSNGSAALFEAHGKGSQATEVGDQKTDKQLPVVKMHHTLERLLCQRVFMRALNYEEMNDHDGLRDDIALQTAYGSNTQLASMLMV